MHDGTNISTARTGDFYLNGSSCSREGANICAERSGDFYLNGDSGHSAKGGTEATGTAGMARTGDFYLNGNSCNREGARGRSSFYREVAHRRLGEGRCRGEAASTTSGG